MKSLKNIIYITLAVALGLAVSLADADVRALWATKVISPNSNPPGVSGTAASSMFGTSSLNADIIAGSNSGPAVAIVGNGSDVDMSMCAYDGGTGYQAYGSRLDFLKTRSTSATCDANTTGVDGDIIGSIRFFISNGTTFSNGANIVAAVNGTMSGGGAADAPTSLDFQVSPDGSATAASALKISNSKAITLGGTSVVFGTATGATNVISTGSTDAADSNQICLAGAATTGVTRGGSVCANGNEATAGYGFVALTAGNVANGSVAAYIHDTNTIAGQSFSWRDYNYDARFNYGVTTSQSTALSGATYTFNSLIPTGAIVDGVVCRVTTLITGASAFTIGDESTADLWGTGIALAAGTKTTSANFLSTYTPTLYAAGSNVVLTATTSNFTGGVVRCSALYHTLTGPNY